MDTLWSPPPTRIRIIGPRCPFCLDAIESGEPQLACNRCRAWHHQECWTEGRKRCSACRSKETGRCRRVLEAQDVFVPSDLRLAALWGTLAALFFVVNAWLLPPFREVFQDWGIVLPRVTSGLVDSNLPWAVALVVLLLVQLGACTGGQTRRHFVVGALSITAGFGLWATWALLLPVIHMIRLS